MAARSVLRSLHSSLFSFRTTSQCLRTYPSLPSAHRAVPNYVRSFYSSPLSGAKKTPTGASSVEKKSAATLREEEEEKERSWQKEEEMAKLAEAPEGVHQEFWDFQRELTVRTAPTLRDQKEFPPDPPALGQLIEMANSVKELELVFPVMKAWRKRHLPVTQEHTDAICNKAYQYDSPDTVLQFFGNGAALRALTDGSHLSKLMNVYVDRIFQAKEKQDPEAELEALDSLFLSFALIQRYKHIPDHSRQVAQAFPLLIDASIESTLEEGWRRAVITASEWEFQYSKLPSKEKESVSFSHSRIEEVKKLAVEKGYVCEEEKV